MLIFWGKTRYFIPFLSIFIKIIYVDDIYDSLCVILNVSVYRTFKLLLVICFSNFILVVIFYYMGRRFALIEKEEHPGTLA